MKDVGRVAMLIGMSFECGQVRDRKPRDFCRDNTGIPAGNCFPYLDL